MLRSFSSPQLVLGLGLVWGTPLSELFALRCKQIVLVSELRVSSLSSRRPLLPTHGIQANLRQSLVPFSDSILLSCPVLLSSSVLRTTGMRNADLQRAHQ